MEEKKYSLWSNYKFLYTRLWKGNYKLVLRSLTEGVLDALCPLIAAMLPAMIVGLLEHSVELPVLAVICLGAFTIYGTVSGMKEWLEQRNYMEYIFFRLGTFWTELLEKILDMDYVLYEKEEVQNAAGKAEDAISNNNGGVEGVYHYTPKLLTAVLGLTFYSLILTRVHPLIVAALLLLSVIQYAFYRIAENYEEKHREEQTLRFRYQKYMFHQATDAKNGKDIRMFQLQSWLTKLFWKYNKEYQRQLSKNQTWYYLYDFVGLSLNLLRDGVCYVYLIYLLTKGMSISEFVLYLGVVSGYGAWFQQISSLIAELSHCFMEINHLRSFLDLENIYLRDSGAELKMGENSPLDIRLEHVSFRYPNSEKLVLEDISVHIKKGEKLALVGVNGAGKTTLVKMLCGFYQPTSGHIYINDVDITNLNIEAYFKHISVLFQDSIKLSYSIAENIGGSVFEEVEQKKLWEVLEKSGLKEKVQSLEKQEKTFLGKDIEEDGIQLSGGQIQKLFLARALYKNANLLILDEPTAALDALAESKMYEKYAELTEHKTSVFISHRLSSTRFCDRILFLENGKITEQGSHEELLNQGGSYANMFQVQSQYYVEEDSLCQ